MKAGRMTEVQKAMLSERIYEECEEAVRWAITRKFGHMGKSVVYDALQETWKRMIEHFDEVYVKDQKGRIAWLITVANNYIIDTYRSARHMVLVEDVEMYMREEGKEEDPVSSAVIDKILATEIINQFTEEEKKLLFARRLSPLVAAGQDEKKSKNAENCKRHRAKKKMLRYIEEQGFDE